LQQILPVASYLIALQTGMIDQRMLVIEEPELHLHPAVHGAVATLATSALAAHSDAQIIVESHSENFVLRLRSMVANGLLDPADVNIVWCAQDSTGSSSLHEILINQDGSVTDWPSGVFSEDLEEVRSIARAARQ
jgi:predicted ATPase